MSNLLLIGGTGFFGKSVIDGFNRGLLEPWGICSIDVISRGANSLKQTNPSLISNKVRLHELDITNCQFLPEAKYVIHAAASTDARNYLNQSEIEKKNILAAAYNYCELAKKFHLKSKVVFCSSGAVYGQQSAKLEYLSEDTPLAPINTLDPVKRDYAAAKRDSENAFKDLALGGLSVAIARCFAFVGQYLPRDQHFAIGNFLNDAIRGQIIKINSPHHVYRSYMYADDLVIWLMSIAEAGSSSCPIFNVGSDQAIELDELCKKISLIIGGYHENRKITDSIIDRYIPSICKAKEILGLQLEYDLNKSLHTLSELLLK